MEDFEAQVAEAMREVETGVADGRGDFPDANEDDLYYEIAQSIAAMYGPQVGREVKRRLGF